MAGGWWVVPFINEPSRDVIQPKSAQIPFILIDDRVNKIANTNIGSVGNCVVAGERHDVDSVPVFSANANAR